jgi:ubiquinone/menaquinone biosynthesis C-methylase UbiE
LITSDFSPEMVEVARRRGEELDLDNAQYRVLDAENINLRDDAVDGVLCRWGYMLMADPATALAETRRVLRPGGRLVLSVWGRPEDNPWGSVVARLLVERGYMQLPVPGAPGVFSMGTEERTRTLLANAGFGHVETAEIPVRFAFRDLDDYMSWAVNAAGALAIVLRGVPEEERAPLQAEIGRAFDPFSAGDGYEIPARALNAVAS